jgi:O-antigen/teichoic acid export membrane protein
MNAETITTRARRGAIWSLIIAAVAFPLVFFRDALLIRAGGAELRGSFELLLLFVAAIHTFFFPGGRNVLPTYLPKMKTDEERSRLIGGFLILVLGSGAVAYVVLTVWPGLLDLLLNERIDSGTRVVLYALVPFALVSALANSAVMGNLSFVWSSLLLRSQLVLVTLVAGTMFVTQSKFLIDHALLVLSSAMVAAAVVNLVVSSSILFRNARLSFKPLFPPGCLRFTAFTYLDTVMVFAYTAIDKYFVFAWFGISELGVYGTLLVVARVIPMAVQQLGHLLLATFSRLIGTDSEAALVSGYRRVARLTVGFYAAVAVTIIAFSKSITAIYGSECAEHYDYLIALAVVMNIDSLRTVNGMTLMAYEKVQAVFVSKLLQAILQLGLTFGLIDSLGVFAVIVGKGGGHVISSVVLVMATSKLREATKLVPPRAYLTGQLVVVVVAVVTYCWADDSIVTSLAMVVTSWAAIWFLGGFNGDDVRSVLPARFSKRGVRGVKS